jgi:hypothetical protein
MSYSMSRPSDRVLVEVKSIVLLPLALIAGPLVTDDKAAEVVGVALNPLEDSEGKMAEDITEDDDATDDGTDDGTDVEATDNDKAVEVGVLVEEPSKLV